MNTRLNPYISFKDTARSAMEFYKTVFGGELKLTTFAEGKMTQDPAEKDKIMHAELTVTNEIVFMASDTPPQMPYNPGKNMSMSLSGDNAEQLREYWSKLAEGGQINMPLSKAPWGDEFGMLTDKFGIDWMVNITVAKV